MKRIYETMDVVFKMLTEHDFDAVYCIDGDEGLSKSTLLMHIVEYWYKRLYGRCTEKEIKFICLDGKQFAGALRDMKKFEAIGYDEAGELSNKRTMSKFNYMISQTYQVIRGDNLLTILVLPSIFDLDPFFRKRRIKGLFHVTRRGVVAFYSKSRLERMLEMNEKKTLKRHFYVKPTFYDSYPRYTGVLASAYKDKKITKMKGIRERLYEELMNNWDVKEEKEKKRKIKSSDSQS